MPESPKDLGGRPTDFKDDYIHQAYVACADGGFTNAKLGKLFKVTIRTISNWLRTIPEFKAAVQIGKDEHDCGRVEVSFLKRAVGFRYTETTREPNESGTMVVTKKITKYVAPDAKACLDWLCNRNPDRWKKLKHVEVTGKGGGPIETRRTTDFPKEPETIAEWEQQVQEAKEKRKKDEKTPPDFS